MMTCDERALDVADAIGEPVPRRPAFSATWVYVRRALGYDVDFLASAGTI
jgi:hypothetical protein